MTGSPRVARDIVADLYNNIQKWNDFHIKGSTIVKKIVAVKSESQENYTIELEEYTKALFEVMTSLVVYRNSFDYLTSQIIALSKLQKNNRPLFMSLSVADMAEMIGTIGQAYKNEFEVRQFKLALVSL